MNPGPDGGTGGGAATGGGTGGAGGGGDDAGTGGGSGGGGGGGGDDGGTGGGAPPLGGGAPPLGGGAPPTGGGAPPTGGGGTGPTLLRSSRSSPVDITTDDTTIAMVNQDSNSLSIFSAAQKTRTASVNFGNDTFPVAVAIHPDRATAFVVLRRTGQLAKVTGINTVSPAVDPTRATVGAEPTGVALTPSGGIAVVANFNEGTLSFVDTATMSVIGTANVGGNPRALAITNDLDTDDFDEKVYVTQFFGDATSEMTDNGRVGKVNVVDINTRAVTATISLNPIADTGFANTLADGGTSANVGCGINQLFSIALNNGKGYVTSVCAAPAGPVFKFTNVFAAISVFDLATDTENTGIAGTVALSRLIAAQGSSTSNLLGVPVGIDFRPGTNVAYVASQAGDTVQRVHFRGTTDGRGPIVLGPDGVFAQINTRGTGGIKVPNGIVVANAANVAYVANWAERSLSIIDLNLQVLDTDVNSAALPTPNTPEAHVLAGIKFFFTGTGRWSDRSVNSCGSCHPDGLSDHITWQFAAGPRQSTPLDGTYAKNNPNDQRVLNWTGIFDEMHDFELNTRGTAGGKGAITTGTPPMDVAFNLTNGVSLDGGVTNITRNDFLSGSTKAVVASAAALKDWDEIDEYAKTIKPLKAPRNLVTADVTAGAGLFATHNCAFCHGGPKWANSRVPYAPSPEKNGSLPGANMLPAAATGLRTQNKMQTLPMGPQSTQNTDTLKVDIERGVPLFNGMMGNVGPERITCSVRDVGTFNRMSTIERKADGTQAQGIKGFNPPSLLSINVGAPFFHHGAARRLEDVFTSPWAAHYQAASVNFLANGGTTPQEQTEIRQLVAYLRSIDETTAPLAIPAAQDICGGY